MLIPYLFGEVTYDGSEELALEGKECRRICVLDTNRQKYSICSTKDYLQNLFSGVDQGKKQILKNAKIIYGREEEEFENIGLFKDGTTVFYKLCKSMDPNGVVTKGIKGNHQDQMIDDAYCYIHLSKKEEVPEELYISIIGNYRMNWAFQYPSYQSEKKDSKQNILFFKIGQQILFYRGDRKSSIRLFLSEKAVKNQKSGHKKSLPWITVKVKRSYREEMTVSWILGESMPENSLLTEVWKCSEKLADEVADAIFNLPFSGDRDEIKRMVVKKGAASKSRRLWRRLLLG